MTNKNHSANNVNDFKNNDKSEPPNKNYVLNPYALSDT